THRPSTLGRHIPAYSLEQRVLWRRWTITKLLLNGAGGADFARCDNRMSMKVDRMAETVSDFFWKRLSAWGVKRIFGYPGDGINGLVGALDRARDKLDFVQVRHEEMAAFMACGHA